MIERMVLFGASGDLTSRLLLPAVAQLAEAELLPPALTMVGSDITDWSTNDFRETSPARSGSMRTSRQPRAIAS